MLRLKELRKKNHLTQSQVADIIGISQPAYSSWENEKSQMDYDSMLALAALYHVSIEYLLGADQRNSSINWQSIHMSKRVRKGTAVENAEEAAAEELIPPDMALTGEYFALRIKGDSMAPRIMEGDAVIVRRQEDCEDGDIAVITAKGGFSAVKKVRKNNSGITLISLNAAYEPIFFSNEYIYDNFVKIIGKVVELRGRL